MKPRVNLERFAATRFPVQKRADWRTLGRLKSGERNKTEAAYERHLEGERIAGNILWYAFEPIKLRLADDTFFTPDFAVLYPDGVLELVDVKGSRAMVQDDSRVKIKVAASLHPFRFIAAYSRPKKDGGGWDIEKF
jgi:hypothetical protein